MWSVVRQTLVRGSEATCSLLKQTKRYAGHSKWANIKHTKALKDGQRAVLFSKLIRLMNVAIAEEGSYKPTDNVRLAQAIEQAKKKNMPVATIKNVLDRAAKATTKSQTAAIDLRGPGGCIMIIEVYTDNLKRLKMEMQCIFRKFNFTVIDQSRRYVFNHKGVIITEPAKSLDDATEDAIAVGAEDVEEFEDEGEKFFRFTCDPNELPKVANLLARTYKIVSSEEQFTPHIFANLSDADIERVEAFCARLESLDEVSRFHDNIA